jgi:hypothetical protein
VAAATVAVGRSVPCLGTEQAVVVPGGADGITDVVDSSAEVGKGDLLLRRPGTHFVYPVNARYVSRSMPLGIAQATKDASNQDSLIL